jgi:quercetin dioxygenase-like cupin family protein
MRLCAITENRELSTDKSQIPVWHRNGKAMKAINLIDAAEQLPAAWRSEVFARIGTARFKLSRMDGAAYPDERHDHPEVLVVLDGQMNLVVDGVATVVRSGEMVCVDAGVLHGVAAGSAGTLLIFNQLDGGSGQDTAHSIRFSTLAGSDAP